MTSGTTLSSAIWPAPQTASLAKRSIRNCALAIGFSAIIGLLAHVQFRISASPVPITGQTLGVLLTGALLGPRLGMATIALYIAEGYFGLPVFASLGGVMSLGYLFGFIPAAGVVGLLSERGWDSKPLTTALMMASGSIVIYTCGVFWLQRYIGGIAHALVPGVLVFLPGDVIKASIAAALLPTGWHFVGKRPRRDVA